MTDNLISKVNTVVNDLIEGPDSLTTTINDNSIEIIYDCTDKFLQFKFLFDKIIITTYINSAHNPIDEECIPFDKNVTKYLNAVLKDTVKGS